jgi:hypothetical protein
MTKNRYTKLDDPVTKALADALRDVFGEHTKSQRFVDVTRIPLICKSIFDTNENLKAINEKLDTKYVTKEAFNPIQKVVYGLISLILVSVVGAILVTIIK